MKILIVKKHDHYAFGEHDVSAGRANYLISMGVANAVVEQETYPAKEEKVIEIEKENKIAPVNKIERKRRGRKSKNK